MNLPGAPLQNCLLLKLSVTSTTPGMCLGGVCTRIAWHVISSLHTSIVPKTTCTRRATNVIDVLLQYVLQGGPSGRQTQFVDIKLHKFCNNMNFL